MSNPVIPIYAADPDAHLIGDRYYIYATHAGFYPETKDFLSGKPSEVEHGFSAWSSADLVQWKSEGPILRFRDLPWARDLPNAWAPCLAERNGRHYFYFCADSRIGVAVSDSPTGPFADAKGEPLVEYRDDLSAIDPMVFIDDDGQAYLYWGAVPGFWLEGQIEYVRMHLSVQKLAPDMVTLVGEEIPTIFTRRLRDDWHDLDHIEASHVIKRNGIYYLMWSEGSFSSDDLERSYRVKYATAVSPLGPWHVATNNPMLSSRPEIGAVGPGHHGVIQIPGTDEYWCVYHCHPGDADRRVWIDRLSFEEDGKIAPILPTLEGPSAQPLAFALILKRPGPFEHGNDIQFEILGSGGFSLVEIFAGSEKIGETTDDGWTWKDAPRGFHKVYARAESRSVMQTPNLNLDVV